MATIDWRFSTTRAPVMLRHIYTSVSAGRGTSLGWLPGCRRIDDWIKWLQLVSESCRLRRAMVLYSNYDKAPSKTRVYEFLDLNG